MFNKQFDYRRATSRVTPVYHRETPPQFRGGPIVPYGATGGPPSTPIGKQGSGGGGGFGQASNQPVVTPQVISWWWIPLGVAGIVQAFAWIVSHK